MPNDAVENDSGVREGIKPDRKTVAEKDSNSNSTKKADTGQIEVLID
jgi:hypothetical protein